MFVKVAFFWSLLKASIISLFSDMKFVLFKFVFSKPLAWIIDSEKSRVSSAEIMFGLGFGIVFCCCL
jgi:hypothetical protein